MTGRRVRLHERVILADCPLEFLPAATGDAAPDMTLSLRTRQGEARDTELWYRNADSGNSTTIDRTDDSFVVRFADGTSFGLDPEGRSIVLLSAPSHYTTGDLAVYALGPVFAFALHLQGSVLLHASAVVIDSQALVFAGPGGSGKSTTAAILAREGYRVLADDLTEVTEHLPHRAVPSAGMLRLWCDSVDALSGRGSTFPDVAPSWEKKLLLSDAAEEACEIAAILFLEREREEEPHIERVLPREAWTRLLTDSFTAHLPGQEMARRIFDVTTSLAEHVPAYRFRPPRFERTTDLGSWLSGRIREAPQ